MQKLRKSAPWVAAAVLAVGGVAVAQEVVDDGTPPDFSDGERIVSLQTGGTEKSSNSSGDGSAGSEQQAAKSSGTCATLLGR